ncbi:UCH-domain-containing protein [Xylaria nigripes]|nr:UCH-domain-containing protein [Xylaria nigripes]
MIIVQPFEHSLSLCLHFRESYSPSLSRPVLPLPCYVKINHANAHHPPSIVIADAIANPTSTATPFFVLPQQLAVKTSSLKKRKIEPRRSATRNEQVGTIDSPDIPVQSCEQDSDPSFPFALSTFDIVPASSAYRANPPPPASSLPPRLQTNQNGSLALEDRSSVASSPSGAYADLSLCSDRGADTPAPDLLNCPRGTSPLTKTTHHRAVMGGAAEFPDRASSPLKRRASSMELEGMVQDVNEDVEMVSVPDASASTVASISQPLPAMNDASGPVADSQEHSEPITPDDKLTTAIDATPAPQPPVSIEAHINDIRGLVEEFNRTPLKDEQECYIVSRQWLSNVPLDSAKKQVTRDLSTITPVDNSDIIAEVIDDPCVGSGVSDLMRKKFVRLKSGYGEEHFIPFPPKAWELLMQWPGLKEGQIPIRRTATDSSTHHDGSNVQIEFHPLVLTIHRLWSAHSLVPVDAALKAVNPPPPRLARSSNMKFHAFLKQAKAMIKLDLTQRVRGWQIPNASVPYPMDPAVPTPPASPIPPEVSTQSQAVWDHLLVDVESFTALERESERLLISFSDMPNNAKKSESSQTLRSLGIAKDQPIVLDPHEEGSHWTSNFVPSDAMALPTRTNSTTALTVQNHAPQGERTSPAPNGPVTRGRVTKSGRTLGCVGLTNLGNTCYMNAALQCLRSVEELTKYFLVGEWQRELNKANVLAHNGEVAAVYAHLLKEIYKDPPSTAVAPRQFKNTIGRHAPQFSGYGQQDSQEFLGFLLDGLQEDLSRVKKKPYIEKPDSTDEMIGDPEAIRKMADEVWDITRKRDDSVIADLFTGLYKSTLVCPVCDKVSITFDPFNNLTLQLPIANKWNHTVKFFPLNDRPIEIRVELDKHDSIRALKQFVSVRTGVPVERLHGCEEWNKKFYKHYLDTMTASEEITGHDRVWVFELEASPTNYPGKMGKQQKYRSLLDETPSLPWNDEEAERLLVPVMHRRLAAGKNYHFRKWESVCAPFFIVVTPQEARSEDIIRRKVLEKVATLTKHPLFTRSDESDSSEGTSTEPDMIGPNGSDTSSSIGGKVVAQSVKSEDDFVDVQMKDVSENKNNSLPIPQFNRRRPAWVDSGTFLPPHFQNLFEMGICTELSSAIPTGNNSVADDKDYPRLSSRVPAESPSSEDPFDNEPNGTGSNDDTSSDEAPQRSAEISVTRMNEESDEDSGSPVKSFAHRPKPNRPGKNNTKLPNGRKKMKPSRQYGNKGAKKRLRQQQQRQQQQQQAKQNGVTFEDSLDLCDPVPDGGPLIRLREGIVVDWSENAYEEIFGTSAILETFDSCDTLPDADLDKAQAARAKRRKQGLTLDECLDEFERDEVLSEQDMWYCPRCKEHRRASKKLDLWKTPDILVVHLKRFSSSGYRRDKLETHVEFPTEDLDITSRVLQLEEGKQEKYDLIGVDCHYGGLGGGHYTAYAKNFNDGQWYSYNDSSVSKTSVDRIVDSSAYMLFYRRKSDAPLGGSKLHKVLERYISDDETSEMGEGQRLGEASSRNGSSSALLGAEVSRLAENRGGTSEMALVPLTSETPSFGSDNRADTGVLLSASSSAQSGTAVVDEDEGIDMEDSRPSAQPFTSTWSFENIPNTVENSPFSGAASDEAQYDSSADERALSPPDDMDPNLPGMFAYKLPQLGDDRPAYVDHLASDSAEQPLNSGANPTAHKIHEVIPNREQESQSDDATEIHLDDNDKIKIP